ncbi:unnamed protein product, partial [Rotaria socialis]
DDMIGDHGSTPVQKSRSNNSSTCQININVEENLIHLDDPLASDETDNNEPNPPSNVVPKTTTKTKQDVWEYFTKQYNGEVKCNLCPNSSKAFPKSNQLSDTNLRSHLGRAHKFTDFLYPSQRPTKQLPEEETLSVSGQNKKALDTAAIQAIIEDSHAFNIFRKSGMQKFLSLATPGYRGPNRKTVVKRLKSMYKERRSTIRNNLSSISDISLSVDIWKSIRQDHFLCLSAHYYDDHYEANSHVISFRRFLGTHYSDRIEQFISHEIEKLNIEAKIRSITTDNGADIRLAAQNQLKFGTRISCLIHVLNLVVQNGMWLFKIPKRQTLTLSSSANTTSSTITITKSNRTSSKTNTIKSNTASSSSNNIKSNSALSASSTSKYNTTATALPDSFTEDDDDDFTINDDQVLDEVSDDNKSDNMSEGSDIDKSSDNTSITTSSLSDNESNWSSPENNTDNDELNEPLSSTITEEEEFLSRSFAEPSILLIKVNVILKRVRRLVAMIRNTSGLNRYVIKEIKLLLENINRQREAQNKKKINFKHFTLDMKIRWNSSFIMISRFVLFSPIITSLTHNPSKEINLKPHQYRKLKKLSFTSLDWSILTALENVLEPFNHSTKIFSSRRRPTLSINQSFIHALRNFLTLADDAPLTIENLLKKQLLLNLNFYFDKHVSDEQCKAMLISSFLDPTTYPFLSCNDKKEAETIICNEAKQHYKKLNSQSLTSSNQSSITKPSNKEQQSSQATILQNFFLTCGIKLQATSTAFKPSTIKEEIAQYVATVNLYQTFSQYWYANKDRLPILSSFVRQYNIMCATSIDCESSFSIAGFIHRKNRSSLAPSTLRYSMILREQVKNEQT